MDEAKNFPRHRVLRSSRGLKEKPWVHDELNVLQLDFMDRHVAKIADERDAIQKKTFTKWVNNHLRKAGGKVTDLFVDLRDGHNLLTLLELLSNEKLPREKGKMRWHMLQNIETALKFLQQKNVKVVNIRPVDIYDGNPKLCLGLIWTIILHFQISDIMLGNDENVSAREALLRWAKKTTEKYPGVQINDFTTSWRDGLAFSAVLHRNRPDLVDWRNIFEIKSRERLERVFSTMEKEFSVYKILDPQDVDISTPDEKSMITYISSIYHVFPQPPKVHPLMDGDSQTQSQEYRTQAQKLLIWCREKTIMLQERTLDRDITSLKKLLEDLKKLRNIEVPERQKDKHRLTVLYSQLERYFSSVGETSLELDLRPESLELFWYRLITALADKEHELLLHIQHLQQLEMLADKVIREVEQFDQKITDISFRISNESSRIDKIHRLDARTIVETIETEIELLEKPIEQMIKDCHALIDGNHVKSKDLYSDATQVNQKYSQLRTTFHLQMLSKMSPTRDLTNGRSLEHNPYLRDIEQHISWCQQRLSNILQATWGSDYNSITSELDKHQVEHKTIDQYHSKVLQSERQQANLSGDEAHLYQQKLNQLKKIYAELLSLSTKRLCDLHALHDFITVATDELNWLSTHENIELNRDWSDTSMELMQLNSSYKQLVNEFNGRDQQIRAAMEKGEGLVAQHPASKMVASYMQEIQEQRSWIYQLIHCFEVHFKHLADFQNFYNDVNEQKEWLVARKDLLETKYSDSDFNLDRGDILLRGMQNILEELNQFSVVVDKLAKRSQSIVPLTERKYLIHNKPYTVQSLCTYKQDDQIVLEKGEVADLIDTSQQVYWKVKTIKGGEKIIPSACLMIPPPNEEAFELVNKLRLSQQKMIELWQNKQIHLRRNMILATIRVVKEWSFEHFVALGYEQRNDIRRALNEDSDKVLAETDPTDQQIVHLKQEMIDVNRLFDEFERRASSEEENKQTSQLFNEKCLLLSSRLESLAKELDGIILSRLPQDRTASDAALETILDFNRRLGFFDSDLKNLKETFRSIPLKSPAQKKNLDNLNELYKELITQANLHKERLNLLESSLTGLEKNGDIIKDLENVLASHIIMPSTIEGLRELLKQLTALQEIIYENQSSMDKTNNSANQLGRMGVPTKIIEDLKQLHTRVERLNSRWNNVNLQLADRIQSVETAIGLLKNLQTSLILEETWVETQTQKLKLLPTISNALDLDQAVIERFALCEENISILLKWINDIEQRLSKIGGPQEHIEELQAQINVLKHIKNDIDLQARPVASCLEQVRQLVLTSGNVLSIAEVTQLENSGRQLRFRVDRAHDSSVKLIKHLQNSYDELDKLQGEMHDFSRWLQSGQEVLDNEHAYLSDLKQLPAQSIRIKELLKEIIAHQADLRFITISTQKFVDEGKDYLNVLNDLRLSLPERLPNIEPIASFKSPVRQTVSDLQQRYSDLLNQVNAFADRQNNIKECYRIYIEQLEKTRTWLSDVQLRVSSVIAHPVGTDIETIQEQSNIAKSLYNEFLANGKLIDHLQQSLNGLLVSLTGVTTPSENAGLEIPVDEVKRDYKSLLDAVDNRCKLLEVAYVQAQGVQDALDNLIAHMKQTEDKIHIQSQPASLIVEKLLEQIREHQFILSDLETHRASLNSVTESAKELLKVPSNARLAKVIETKLQSVTDHYSRLRDKAINDNEFLEAILKKLTKFNNDSTVVENELKHLQELSNIEEKSVEVLMKYLQDIVQNRKKIQPAYEDCIYLGKDLVERKDVTDTYVVKDKLKRLQTLWESLERRLDDKLKLTKQKSEKLGAFEICKTEIYLWLSQMETRTSAFDPVALDLTVIRRQSDEHKLLLNEYKEFNRVISRINDIGAEYDSLIRTSSPIMNNSVDRQDLTDLTSMQQELLEINNRYNFIGVRLNDRQKDLDDTRTAVQRQKENLEGLNSFLDKLEKNLPKYNLTVRENAEKCIKHVRKQQDEMYERQSTLDTTKIQIRELLQLKPNAPGSEALKYELDNVVDRWQRLAELLKECSIYSEQSLDFIETHDLIFNWLISKEKLFSVLGPISSDPRTVSSQMQQVSVLRDEFKAQQTQLDYLRDIGGGLVNHFQPTSQEGKAITNKMNDIEKKWNDLADQLEKRYKNLTEVADTSKDFDASLNRLRENLQQISDSLDNLPSDSDFEGKLHKITQLERQLEGQRPLLADAEATAATLTSVISDAKSSAEIKAKVQALGKQYLALQRKLDNIKAENDAALKDKKHFLENCAKTIGWIGSKLANFTSPLLISAHKPTLQYQIETHEPIYREVISKEYEIIMLLNRGKDLQQKLGELKDLEKINSQWTQLKEEAQDRQTRLQKAYDVYKNYEKTSSGFLQWLSNAERDLIAMKPGMLVKKELDKELRDVQTLRNDVLKKSSDYDKTQNLCGNFLTACDVDKDTLMSEMQSTKDRWDELNRLINLKIERINNFVEKVMDFSDNFRQLSALVQRNEDAFDSLERIHGANAGRDPRSLEKIKTIKDDNSELKKNFQNLRGLVENIASEARPVGYNSDNLYGDLERLSDRILTLQSRLDDRFNDLTIASNEVAKFNESINHVTLDLSALENEVDGLSAPAREVKVVRSQLDAGNDLLQKIEDIGNKISGIEANGDTMIEKGYVTRPSEVHEPLDQIKRKRSRLESRTKDYIEAVQKALKLLTRFYEDYEVALNEISQIDFELKKLKTIGSEAAQIRLQQQDFQLFRRNVVDPMERKIDDLNDLGKDLIRSAHETVSTGNLEHDLEKIVEKWSEIKTRVSERDRKLDQALLQSGKFQDALQGILRWLADSEEMIKNQKSPSIDYKVAKAQLQEQKFLMKMIGDNQNSVSSILKLGEEVLQGCEPGERMAVEMQLKDLTGRFDHLKNKAGDRTKLLENAVDAAKTLQDQLTPLVTFLDRSERTLKNLENIPSDEDKIQQAIYEHDRLNSEIMSKDPDVAALVSLKNSIRKYFEPEEAELANEKIDSVSDRYNMLRDDSERLGALLNKTKQEIKQFAIAYQDLFAWCDKQDRTLAQFKNASVHVDVINEQVNKLEDINREIQNKESTIQTTIDIGNELLRCISQDEAFKLKDKLDALGRRYIEISKKSSDYLSNAKDAHALAQDFHGAHNRLVNWMQNAETILVGNAASEIEILTLESDLTKMRSELEALNSLGPQLAQLSSEEGGATIEGIISRDNRRFDAIVEQIQRKAERLQMIAQRSKEINVDLDELIHWFRETEGSLRDAATPSIQPKVVKNQLLEHRSLNDSISGQKGRVREVTANAKKLIRELQSSNDNLDNIREKLEDLKDVVDSVTNLSAERLSILEQVAPLSEHFADAQDELERWLTDTEQEISMLTAPGVRADQIMQQQEKNERLMNTVANHKPLIDKFNKTGDAFATLVARHDGNVIHDVVEGVNNRYNALKTELRERQLALERALQETSQFADKLENMLRTLANAAEQVKNGEQISAHPPKISNQIDENWTIADDLEKREPTFVAIKVAADEIISKATNPSDPAVKEIKMKLEKLNVLWVDVQKEVKIRDSSLNDTLNAAEKFWNELHLVMDKLRELKDTLTSQEPVATEPKAIQRQKSELEEVGREIQNTKPEVDQVRLSGTNLITLIGDAEKPEIKKHIEDLDQAWGNITSLYAQREENLIQAMEKAMQFHETLEALLRFLDEAEEYMRGLKPIGSEIVLVKQQIEEHKDFKDRVDPHGVEIEALNRQLNELSEITSVDQTSQIRHGVNGINKRWESLKQLMNDRQKQLENALLQLGQFEHALNELLVWIRKTQTTFEQIKIVPGDAKLLEIEMAKLKILINDAQAHQNSIDTINDAGRKLLENDDFIDASSTKEKLDNLNRLWQDLQHNITDKERELDEELVEAQNFATEVQDIITWLNDVDSVVSSTKPVGGLPETATEQLEKFMEIYNEIEENRPRVDNLLAQGANYVKKHAELNVSSSNLQHSLRTLKQRWETVVSKAGDKKIKLEIALKEATEFHESLQAFVEWLTDAEKRLTTAEQISRVLPTVTKQVEEHKAFQKEIGTYRESMLQLDKKGSHLKYFSQKQDVILIKNLLVSVQHRWERVVNKGTERMRALDHGLKESKEFYDSWGSLMNWLRENETQMNKIDSDLNGSNDSIKVKQALEKIQNIHRGLSGKQTEYDTILRAGKGLIDKGPKSDEPELTKMLNELKELWTKSCSRSIERQRKLEEILLLSGQFSEALTAILEWLKKAKESLTDETPLHGDIDTVTGLVDMHKRFEADLEKRSKPIDNVIENGKRLDPNNTAPEIIKNLREVESLWSFVKTMNEQKSDELQKAVKEAEKLHKNVNILMEWLSDAEQKLKYAPAIPTDEAEAQRMLSEFNVFLYEMRDKEVEKNDTLELAQNILDRAHPDAIKILRTIIQTIQQRWEDISQWALNRESKLSSHLQSLKDLDGTLDDLLAWLAGLETTLKNLEAEDLPNNVSEVEKLIEDHKEFMENTAGRQNEIDLICKPSKAKPSLKEARKPSRTAMRTTSRLSPSAISEAKAAADNGLPHYGPKFSPSVAEIDFRSPRAKTLWDKWRNVWMLAWDRQKRLHEHLMMMREQAKLQSFDWDDWRKRFLKFHNHKRSRVVEFLKKIDKKQNGLIPREVFVNEIIASKAPTKRFEVEAVSDKFDPVSEGVIDWEDFLIALKPEWQQEPKQEADKIHDEVRRLVMLCTCRQKFRVFQVGEGKYRFGAEQKLRLVRILRSTVMVRVGGGWIALDEFLLKNDPCRARGKTNTELREEFILAAGVSQTMQAFTPRQSISSASPGQPSRDYSSKSRQGSTTADSDHSDSVSAGRRTPSRTSLYTKTSIPIRSSLTPSSASRSKPVSRHGSSMSLASNDESTPTRIPTRKIGTTPKTPTTSTSTKPPVSSASKARVLSKKAEERPPFR